MSTFVEPSQALALRKGWVVLHLFYHVEQTTWQLFSPDGQRDSKTHFSQLVQEIRALPDTQLLTFSILSPKADLGVLLVTPDVHQANAMEKQITLALGADVLTPVYSYLSLTGDGATEPGDEALAGIVAARGIVRDTPEFDEAVAALRDSYSEMLESQLYPNLPDWPVFCFYPVIRRRHASGNWYDLDGDDREKLTTSQRMTMLKHRAAGVLPVITGSTGLDDAEWAVSLFAQELPPIREAVSAMRYEEVSALYDDFGECYLGLQLPLDQLFSRLIL